MVNESEETVTPNEDSPPETQGAYMDDSRANPVGDSDYGHEPIGERPYPIRDIDFNSIETLEVLPEDFKKETPDLDFPEKEKPVDLLTKALTEVKAKNSEISVQTSKNLSKVESTFQQQVAINDEFAYFRVLAERVVASKLTPRGVDTVEKVIVILQTGKELGLPGMAALNNIHVIEGRPSLGIHAVNALIKRAGIDWQTIKDYEPVRGKVVQGDKEVEGVVDYVTQIKFFRKGSTGQIIEETVTYSFVDARTAGLVGKQNWRNYPKIMLWNRCFIIGARRVAPDALLGMYEMSELADVHNIPYDIESVTLS